MVLNSSKTDAIIKETQKNMNNLLKSQQKLNISSKFTTNQFKLQNRNLLQMEKTSKTLASNFRIIGLTLKGLIINKAFNGFQNILSSYGSTLSNFNAKSNKDTSLNVKALERAFKLNTGQEFSDLIDKMGTFASNSTIKGSKEQQLLLQSGINPNEFQKMDSLQRFNTLMDMFKTKGDIKPFRDMLEELTGQSGKTLETLLSKKDKINQDFKIQKSNLKSSMMGNDFENTARSWDKLTFLFNDTLASLMVEITPLLEKFLKIVNEFIQSGGVKKTIEGIKSFFKSIGDSQLIKNFTNVALKMKPFFEGVWKILKWLGGITIDGLTLFYEYLGKLIDRVKFVFNSFPLYFDNFLLSIQEGLKRLKLNALEFTNIGGINDERIKIVNREIKELEKQQSTNDKAIQKVYNEIYIENKIQNQDILAQTKNNSKAYNSKR